jgi:hypothetical protein
MSSNRRFNLIHNNHSIRTIDDLREYCAIEQLLIDYREGKLRRWLKALRGFNNIIIEIDCLSVENDLEIAQELVRILEIKQQIFEDYQSKLEMQAKLFQIYDNSIEQLLIDYREGTLQRFLKALKYFDDLIVKIDCLSVEDDLEIARELVKILGIRQQAFEDYQAKSETAKRLSKFFITTSLRNPYQIGTKLVSNPFSFEVATQETEVATQEKIQEGAKKVANFIKSLF